jgi:hypothetical protein
MTRIVTTHYRYKRPPGREKPVALEVPAVVTTKSSRRPIGKKAAAEIQVAPVSGRKGAVQPSTPREAERAAPAAIVTVRRKMARIIPPGLLPETPEEHHAAAMPPMRCSGRSLRSCADRLGAPGAQHHAETSKAKRQHCQRCGLGHGGNVSERQGQRRHVLKAAGEESAVPRI